MGEILARMDQWADAEKFQKAALEAQPDHVAAHLSYGTMLARNVSPLVTFSLFYSLSLGRPLLYNRYSLDLLPACLDMVTV